MKGKRFTEEQITYALRAGRDTGAAIVPVAAINLVF
jgi:hypothetical protein